MSMLEWLGSDAFTIIAQVAVSGALVWAMALIRRLETENAQLRAKLAAKTSHQRGAETLKAKRLAASREHRRQLLLTVERAPGC